MDIGWCSRGLDLNVHNSQQTVRISSNVKSSDMMSFVDSQMARNINLDTT